MAERPKLFQGLGQRASCVLQDVGQNITKIMSINTKLRFLFLLGNSDRLGYFCFFDYFFFWPRVRFFLLPVDYHASPNTLGPTLFINNENAPFVF